MFISSTKTIIHSFRFVSVLHCKRCTFELDECKINHSMRALKFRPVVDKQSFSILRRKDRKTFFSLLFTWRMKWHINVCKHIVAPEAHCSNFLKTDIWVKVVKRIYLANRLVSDSTMCLELLLFVLSDNTWRSYSYVFKVLTIHSLQKNEIKKRITWIRT